MLVSGPIAYAGKARVRAMFARGLCPRAKNLKVFFCFKRVFAVICLQIIYTLFNFIPFSKHTGTSKKQQQHTGLLVLLVLKYIYFCPHKRIEKKLENRSLMTKIKQIKTFYFHFDYFRFFIALLISLAKSGN